MDWTHAPIVVEFPLRGEWIAPNTPGKRVPSHGTDMLGQRYVGHSGNSTAPHLHFHLMDKQDARIANGLPCCFREYEVLREDGWQVVHNGIPTHQDRIRKL